MKLPPVRSAPGWRALLIVIAAPFVAAGIVVVSTDRDDETRVVTVAPAPIAPPAATAVDGPDADTKRDDALPLSPAAQEELQKAATATERPGDTHRELADPLRGTDAQPAGVLEGPLAAQEFDGCRTRFVRNFSSRAGESPRVIVWHQTVSADRPGGADQDGLTALANNPQSGVSWHLLVGGKDGRCTYTVPFNYKAWTQANANRFSIGIEVQAVGNEPTYVSGPGKAKLLAVTRAIGKRYGIPMRRGLVSNCRPVRSGIVEHSELGACGGGHIDVTATGADADRRAAGWDTQPLVAELARSSRPVTNTDRVTCRKINWWRTHGRHHGPAEANAIRRRQALEARNVRCTAAGPVRTT
jgi:hypothetical protein